MGLSGVGKIIIIYVLEKKLWDSGYCLEVLDGDVVCINLIKGFGFSKEDWDINICCIGFVFYLFICNGVIVLVFVIFFYVVIC